MQSGSSVDSEDYQSDGTYEFFEEVSNESRIPPTIYYVR